MSEAVRAGWESKLYYLDTQWKEITVAKDVEIDPSAEMLEASSRGDGVKRYHPGMIEGKITFGVLAITGETHYEFLKAAIANKTAVKLAWTEGDSMFASGTAYCEDWFYLTGKRGEPLNGMPTLDIEASPAVKRSGGVQIARVCNTQSSTTTTA